MESDKRRCSCDPEYLYLEELAFNAQTDKPSWLHNYTEVYSTYFSPLKNKPIKFLEIGIHVGFSVNLWEDYFPNAELHFIDLPNHKIPEGYYVPKRSHFHFLDQEDPLALQEFIEKTGGDFDIIIDDGGHTMSQQITSFNCLFPHVKKGGLYIIEDLHTSYWEQFGGGDHPGTTISFLKQLIDDVNFVGAKTSSANHCDKKYMTPEIEKELNIYREEIYSIHFYDSLAFIIKRSAKCDPLPHP